MILAAHHLLGKNPQPTLEEIREGLSGNLCRCTGYLQIFDAVMEASRQTPGQAQALASAPAEPATGASL